MTLLLGLLTSVIGAFVPDGMAVNPLASYADFDEPLFLTPYIQNNQLPEARRKAKTGDLLGYNMLSYSGYLTVNESTGSHYFFWFFPTEISSSAPIILWLEGGPGITSLDGLFMEVGPYRIKRTGHARRRNVSWVNQFHMLFIDNPVGTGYSFTTSKAGYVENQRHVGAHLFEFCQQFFTMFSEYSKNDLYIATQSYAGKFGSALGHVIHQNRDTANMKLAGLLIGNGYCDPISAINFADFLLQTGLVSKRQASELEGMQSWLKEFILIGDYYNAAKLAHDMIYKYVQLTGSKYPYNFLRSTPFEVDVAPYRTFVETPQTRRAIHVGEVAFWSFNDTVYNVLFRDRTRSVKPWVAELMDHYRVLIYSSQLDVIVATAFTREFVDSIEWSGADELARANRIIWRDRTTRKPLGYVRQAANFTEVMVRNAGHEVLLTHREAIYDMVDRFIHNKPFD